MDVLEFIDIAFTEHLFISNVISAALFLGLANMFVQSVVIKFKNQDGIDVQHTSHAVIVGCFLGVFNHAWYSLLNKAIVGDMMTSLLLKILHDQMVAGPLFSSAYMLGMAKLEGKSNLEVYREWQEAFWEIYKADWKFWPFAQFINFLLVPKRFTVLYVNVATLCWDVFLSYTRRAQRRYHSSFHDLRRASLRAPDYGQNRSLRKLTFSGVRMISIDQWEPPESRDVHTNIVPSQSACSKENELVESVLVRLSCPSANKGNNTSAPVLNQRPSASHSQGTPKTNLQISKQETYLKNCLLPRYNDVTFSRSGKTTHTRKGASLKNTSVGSKSNVRPQNSIMDISAHVWHKFVGSNLGSNENSKVKSKGKKNTPWQQALGRLKTRLLQKIDGLACSISDLDKDVRRMETSFNAIDMILSGNASSAATKNPGAGDH